MLAKGEVMVKEILAYICWGIALVIIARTLISRRKKNPQHVTQEKEFSTEFYLLKQSIDNLGNNLGNKLNWMFAPQLMTIGAILYS